MDTPFIQLVASLDDKEIANARPVALRLLGLIANVGSIVQEVFGGSGHGRDNVGKSLITMAENSEEQVLALLLTSSFLKDDRVREALPAIESRSRPRHRRSRSWISCDCAIWRSKCRASWRCWRPALVREAFASPDGAERWHATVRRVLAESRRRARRGDGAATRSVRGRAARRTARRTLEPDDEVEIEVEAKKKNLK